MTDAERIEALEARCVRLEARLEMFITKHDRLVVEVDRDLETHEESIDRLRADLGHGRREYSER